MQAVFLRSTLPSLRRNVVYPNCRYLATRSPQGPGSSQQPQPGSSTGPSGGQDGANAPGATGVQPDTQPISSASTTSPGSATVLPSPTSLSLDFSPVEEEPKEHSERTGARSSEGSLSSIERKRRFASRAVTSLFGLGLVGTAVYLGRDWDEEELRAKNIKSQGLPDTRLGRTKARFGSLFDYFSKPVWEELLPTAGPPFQKPYTLLLSIDDLLVTSTWDRQNGWRTAKRPGVDYFLAYLSQFYEIVVFTSQNHYTAIPILEKLDPYNFFISFKLFRESTRSVNGSVVKDLSYLNRDLSKTIIIDTNSDHVRLQPENAVVVPKWNGDPKDKGLVSLIPFLESIAIYKPQDVRPILKAYEGKNIPVEYAKKEAEAKQQFLEEWRRSGKGKKVQGPGFTLSGLFGGSSSEPPTPEPLTYLEQKRREAQVNYRAEQEYIAQNKETFEKLLEQDRQAAVAQMSGSMWNVMSAMGGGPKPIMPGTEGAGTADQSHLGQQMQGNPPVQGTD